ncbi:kallikrein-8 [Bombyx mori]|uniref:kallikrein-8 n=1 Tax=Bombyx mori TaxID=7091 RepID=UPI002ED0B51E
MEKEINFNKKRIRRIKYDRTASALAGSVIAVTVLGWGDTDLLQNSSKQPFSKSEIDVYNLEACKEIYTEHYVTNLNFCAGYSSKGSGACNRDVGGPGVVSNTLVGVISFGSPVCGAHDSPTVFTKLGYYAEWIDGIVKHNGIPLRRSLNALKKRNHKTKNIRRKRIKKEHKIKKPSQFGNKNLRFSKKINTLTEILRN